MAHADMAEGVDDAFVTADAVGDGQFVEQIGKSLGHGVSSRLCYIAAAKPNVMCERKRSDLVRQRPLRLSVLRLHRQHAVDHFTGKTEIIRRIAQLLQLGALEMLA